MTTALSLWRWTTVASGRKTAGYAGNVDARAVGRALNVRYLVDADIRNSANKLTIKVHLIHADGGNNVWSDRLEFDAGAPPVTATTQLTRRLRNARTRPRCVAR
ncbi:MAG TPA: hypothetical protein VNG69_16325 [Casimicrobiaceae bacterium]|nr:hypothetical protein [Casimicrobiaceae bacterium]